MNGLPSWPAQDGNLRLQKLLKFALGVTGYVAATGGTIALNLFIGRGEFVLFPNMLSVALGVQVALFLVWTRYVVFRRRMPLRHIIVLSALCAGMSIIILFAMLGMVIAGD